MSASAPYTSSLTTNNYTTNSEHSRSIFDSLSLGSSLYFHSQFIAQLLRNRKLALAGKFSTKVWASESMRIFNLIENCGGKFHIEGIDNITKSKEAVVFVSNHMSMLESMVFPGLIASKRAVTFVVKSSLVTHPIFGPVMSARRPINVERKDPIADFKKVMNDGVTNLENNTSVVIFPQSKRMNEFDPSQFNTLGIKLAKKANVKIVPVVLKTDFWKNGKLIKDLGGINRKLPIHIKFGEPIEVVGSGKREHQMIIDFICDHLKKWETFPIKTNI